jgi:hypothetical protein
MHVEQTAWLETLDIFSHAAKTGCKLLCRPSPASDAFGFLSDKASEAENEDDVRLMEGMDESDDFMDNGELGELGEAVSGDGGGLSTSSPCHKGTRGCLLNGRSKDGHFREGPLIDINEALAEVVGEKDPDAL